MSEYEEDKRTRKRLIKATQTGEMPRIELSEPQAPREPQGPPSEPAMPERDDEPSTGYMPPVRDIPDESGPHDVDSPAGK